MIDDRKYVYGWGRAKHLRDPLFERALCGAIGGNPLERRYLPVCRNCLRIFNARGSEASA